ncbi:MAG: ATP-binding cassette domain-containing protein, partial [Emergencia timonensis]
MKVIDVQNVYLKYRTAKEDTIRGISFDVKQGEIFGFLGPSGAGKSTMQKILTGTLRDYRGSVRIFDTEMKHRTRDYYENIGVDFEFPNFYEKFTALENLQYFASLYSGRTVNPLTLLEKVGLHLDAGKKVSSYSKG